ncbi:MAG: cytochrome b/b6 domain-containing protein [Burkholderiaceae bacterium]|nr:cytochrome b/b6 domain-containing protein [Burkholderiaceae bacterium]
MSPEPACKPVRIWDLPTRLFHWLLALTVIGSLVSGQIGGNAMVWHIRLGLVVLALLAFRLVWGFAGGYWSRFAAFLYGPRSVAAYLRGERGPDGRFYIGHSPVGALSVWALLGFLALQVATGLIADDEIATTGPLNRFVSNRIANLASTWHAQVGKRVLIVLAIAHVAAVLYYLWRKQRNLIAPMIHGDMPLPRGAVASADGTVQRLAALLIAAAAAALAWWIGSLATA